MVASIYCLGEGVLVAVGAGLGVAVGAGLGVAVAPGTGVGVGPVDFTGFAVGAPGCGVAVGTPGIAVAPGTPSTPGTAVALPELVGLGVAVGGGCAAAFSQLAGL